MSGWLSFLLTFLADAAICYLIHRRAYNKGYEAGMTDSLEISRQVDEILRADPGG